MVCAFVVSAALMPGATAQADTEATTPNSCIVVNGGDLNACNVDHGARGDLPYLRSHSVAGCIQLAEGDSIACRVGSASGYYGG
jgi:hypothetical protein